MQVKDLYGDDAVGGVAGYHLRNFDDRIRQDPNEGIDVNIDEREVYTKNKDFASFFRYNDRLISTAQKPNKYNFENEAQLMAFVEYGSAEEKAVSDLKTELKQKRELTEEDVLAIQAIMCEQLRLPNSFDVEEMPPYREPIEPERIGSTLHSDSVQHWSGAVQLW